MALACTGKVVWGKGHVNSILFASVFYNPMCFPLTEGWPPPCKPCQGTARLFPVVVSITTITYHTACQHLEFGLHEIYGWQFPC